MCLSEVMVRGKAHQVIKVFLKHPKEERLSSGVFIDLLEVKGKSSWLCHVAAFLMWKAEAGVVLARGMPLMRMTDSLNYTGAKFNVDTAMSKAGYSDEEIMAVGRWRSSTFLQYVNEKNGG